MMFSYPEFFEELFSTLARPGILAIMPDPMLTDLVKSIGYLQFHNESVDTILAHVKDTLDPSKDVKRASFWVETVLNLNSVRACPWLKEIV